MKELKKASLKTKPGRNSDDKNKIKSARKQKRLQKNQYKYKRLKKLNVSRSEINKNEVSNSGIEDFKKAIDTLFVTKNVALNCNHLIHKT